MIEQYIMPRGMGKTYNLMRDSSMSGAIIVTPSRMQAHILKEQAKGFDFDIPDPISFSDFISLSATRGHKPNPNGYLIDNLDYILELYNVKGFSGSFQNDGDIDESLKRRGFY